MTLPTFTHVWDADGRQALIHADGAPAGMVEWLNGGTNQWRVGRLPGMTPDEVLADLAREDGSLALLKAVIWLDEHKRGVGSDHSTRQPPPAVRNVASFREKFEDDPKTPWVAGASDDTLREVAHACWLYTHAKVRRSSGLDYDEWERKQFMASAAIFKSVVRKYGTNVPDPDFA